MNKTMSVADSRIINVKDILSNHGQVPGLPKNPRVIKDERFNTLKQSILENPEMISYREILVYPFNGKYVVIGGNMRFAALKELGVEDIPCKIIDPNSSVEQLKAYMVKDNNSFGEWNFSDDAWNSGQLLEWGIADDIIATPHSRRKSLGWGKSHNKEEHRCNLKEMKCMHEHNGALVFSVYKRTQTGYLLDDIKNDDSNIDPFADDAITIINKIIGLQNHRNIAIITTPKRRHKENNFADRVAGKIAQKGGFVFYPDAVIATNRDRIKPKFQCQTTIREQIVIVYDDIITTGTTITATGNLFPDKNKIYVASISNK